MQTLWQSLLECLYNRPQAPQYSRAMVDPCCPGCNKIFGDQSGPSSIAKRIVLERLSDKVRMLRFPYKPALKAFRMSKTKHDTVVLAPSSAIWICVRTSSVPLPGSPPDIEGGSLFAQTLRKTFE